MMASVDLLFRVCFSLILVRLTFQCLQTGGKFGLPRLRDYRGVENDNRIFRHHQAIVSTYRFDCCGNVTEWGADVFQNNQDSYSLDFQVWRPSPTEDNDGTGCYSLVGNNRFNSITLSGGVVRVTPSPQDYIQFRPNDVVGFYVESASIMPPGFIPNGVVLQTRPVHFTSESVWYASIAPSVAASSNIDCPYSVGFDGVLNTLAQAAPVISISTTTYPCSQLLSSSSSAVSDRSSSTSTSTTHTGSTSSESTQSLQTVLVRPTNTAGDPTMDGDVGAQPPWLLIGSVVASVLVLVILMAAVFIVVCCVKMRKGKNSNTGHERLYDTPYGAVGQTDTADDSSGDETSHSRPPPPIPAKPVKTKKNEAYAVKSRKPPMPLPNDDNSDDEHIYSRLHHKY